jgi:hypothetical protein
MSLTTGAMIRTLGLPTGITGEVALQRAEHDGWLIPSVRRRHGQGDAKTHGAQYNDEDVYVWRVVTSVYPREHPAIAGRNALRADLARLVRSARGWPYVFLCANDNTHDALFCTDVDMGPKLLEFIADHPGQVVTTIDLASLDRREAMHI